MPLTRPMIDTAWHRASAWLTHVDSPNREERRRGAALSIICTLATGLTALMIPLACFQPSERMQVMTFTLIGVIVVGYLSGIALSRLGQVQLAGMTTSLIISAAVIVSPFVLEGMVTAVLALPFAVVLAAVAIRPKQMVALLTVNSLGLLAAVWGLSQNPTWSHADDLPIYLAILTTNVAIGITASVASWMTHRSLERLAQARDALELANVQAQEARSAAEASSRAKSAFLANMSHELRTPLNAVLGYAALIQEDIEEGAFDPECAAEDLDRIDHAGRHLLALINDVLDLSRVEAGKMDIVSDRFEVSPLIDEVAATVKPLVDKNDNTLELDVPRSITTMLGDRTRVRQVLFNLLSNAAKFTHEGEITLQVRAEGEQVVFSVSDTGIGIDEAFQSRLFSAFERAEDTSRRQYDGTGLGLSLSKRLVELMGGTIHVDSQLGVGSTFTVLLPAEVAHRVLTPPCPHDVAPSAGAVAAPMMR